MAQASSSFGWQHVVYQVYLALVCLISGIFLAVSVGGLLHGAKDAAWPELGTYRYAPEPLLEDATLPPEKTRPSPEERYAADVQNTRRSGLEDILDASIMLLIAGVIFAGHWRLFRRLQAGAKH